MSHHHQNGPRSGRGDQEAPRSSAHKPGDETEAPPGWRLVCKEDVALLMCTNQALTHTGPSNEAQISQAGDSDLLVKAYWNLQKQLKQRAVLNVGVYKFLHFHISPFLSWDKTAFPSLSNRCAVYLGQLLWVCKEGQRFSWLRLYTCTLHGPGKDSPGNHVHAYTSSILLYFQLS